jgi:hypothetical protein
MRKKISENYLDKIPKMAENHPWNLDENGKVTIETKNVGLMNKIAQRFFKKPETSYIHLDELGSFVWPLIDGEKSIVQIADYVKEAFGEKAEPLYPRLAKYFQILESCKFVEFIKKN